MLKVGITGGIGSGKTTVCKVFKILGVPVYNADIEAKKILDNDEEVKANTLQVFGNEILGKNGFIERPQLAGIVFKDPEKLKHLNNIIHPAVARHFETWLETSQSANYILKEAAILFESNSNKMLDKIITVVAPTELRIKRAMERDNTKRETIEQRINNQMSDEEKVKRSNYVINNDEMELLIPQIIKIHQQLCNL